MSDCVCVRPPKLGSLCTWDGGRGKERMESRDMGMDGHLKHSPAEVVLEVRECLHAEDPQGLGMAIGCALGCIEAEPPCRMVSFGCLTNEWPSLI